MVFFFKFSACCPVDTHLLFSASCCIPTLFYTMNRTLCDTDSLVKFILSAVLTCQHICATNSQTVISTHMCHCCTIAELVIYYH